MIPMQQADGSSRLLLGRVCRPAGEGPARVVVIAHGSPPLASARPEMTLTRCDAEAPRWFLSRGYTVVFALRRGYGGTGGAYAEGNAGCSTEAFAHAGRESAQDLAAVVQYATALPFARTDGAIVVGQSAGGWAAAAYDGEPHPAVAAFVSMAGGRGGHLDNRPFNNCHPENLAEAAGRFGQTARTPMLWVYAANDSYFNPDLARAMHAAFTRAGGIADLQHVATYAQDGHRLFFGPGGSLVWGPLMERYLASRGVGTP